MDKKKLRVGDWVQRGWIVAKIEEMGEDMVILCNRGLRCNAFYNELHPIEITDNLLKENGFVYKPHIVGQWILEGEEGEEFVSLQPRDVGYHTRIKGMNKNLRLWPVRYVHELQHAIDDCDANVPEFMLI